MIYLCINFKIFNKNVKKLAKKLRNIRRDLWKKQGTFSIQSLKKKVRTFKSAHFSRGWKKPISIIVDLERLC